MKYLRKLYESNDSTEEICRNLGIKNFTINSDGSVDVNGSVNLFDRDLTQIPVKFGTVTRTFDCSLNNLTSLENAPHTCGPFMCGHNKITNLFGGPKSARSFDCSYNKITSLEGGPTNVPDSYICEHNLLTSLIGAPESMAEFHAGSNPLTTLEGIPKEVKKVFDISYCTNLFSPYGLETLKTKNYDIEGTPIANIKLLFYLNYFIDREANNKGSGITRKSLEKKILDVTNRDFDYGWINRELSKKYFDDFLESLEFPYIKGNKISLRLLDEITKEYNLPLPKGIRGYTYT